MPETTFGTFVKPTAAGSIKTLSSSITPDKGREDRNDVRQIRSLVERISRFEENEWELSSYALPRGGTTPPDVGTLLAAGFGTETIGGSDVTYSLGNISPISLSLENNEIFCEALAGALVGRWSLTANNSDEPKMTFSGPGKRYIFTGNTTLNGAHAISDTTLELQSGAARFYQEGSIVKVVSPAGVLQSSDMEVTNVNTASDIITVTPGLATGSSDGAEVLPYTPWTEGSTGGSPISIVSGDIDIGSDTDLSIVEISVSLENNVSMKYAWGSSTAVDFVCGRRRVEGQLTLFGRKTDFAKLARSHVFDVASVNPLATTVTLGETSGNHVILSMPQTEFHAGRVETPGADTDDEATFVIPFVALASDASTADELSLQWL
jgi:hypothetical protein